MIIMYTTNCPKCKVLEMKLNQKNIHYEKCDDIEKMSAIGLRSAPALLIDNELLDFVQAINWVNNQ